jgi:hypothetical protein
MKLRVGFSEQVAIIANVSSTIGENVFQLFFVADNKKIKINNWITRGNTLN